VDAGFCLWVKMLVRVDAKFLRNRIRDVRYSHGEGEAVLLLELHLQVSNVVLQVALLELRVQFLLIAAQEEELHLLVDVAGKELGVVSAQALQDGIQRNEFDTNLALRGDVPPLATGLLNSPLDPGVDVSVELLDHPEPVLPLSETVLGARLVRFGSRLQVNALLVALLVRALEIIERVELGRDLLWLPRERFGLWQQLVHADPQTSLGQFFNQFWIHFYGDRFRIPTQSPVYNTLNQPRTICAEALDLFEYKRFLLVLEHGRLPVKVVVGRE